MAKSNKLVAPFLKWVGGKRQIMPSIVGLLPKNIGYYNYVEPFVEYDIFFVKVNRAINPDGANPGEVEELLKSAA
jgi:D12 class N6 adenine-specific DNA methyltransferase